MKNTKTCLSEVLKCKAEIRKLPSNKGASRAPACVQNENFRIQAGPSLEFLQNNHAKLQVMLKGDRDTHPMDLGN